jgi:STAS domain
VRITPVPYREDCTVLVVTGTVGPSAVPALQRALTETARCGVVVDLTRADVVPAAGLGVLAVAARRARAEGRRFAVVAEDMPLLRRLWAADGPIPVHLCLSDALRESAEAASAAADAAQVA